MKPDVRAGLPTRRLILTSLFALCAAVPALGQREECRKPTAAESAAAAKFVSTVTPALEGPLASLGWKLRSRRSDGMPLSIGVDANPVRPLGSCWPLYAATFDMTDANPRFAALKAATDKGMQVGTAWMGVCLKTMKGCDQKPAEMKEGERATAGVSVEIRAGENTPYMRGPHTEPLRKLDVPGAAIAYELSDRDEYLKATTICFGGWKPDVVFSSDKSLVLFPFRHGRLTPFIENLCVVIRATPEARDEIVRKVDWKALNAALTK